MNEITKIDAYTKDLKRIADLTYDESGKKSRNRPDVIHFLLNYFYDNELKNKTNK